MTPKSAIANLISRTSDTFLPVPNYVHSDAALPKIVVAGIHDSAATVERPFTTMALNKRAIIMQRNKNNK
jgi:hypothetical protein